MLTRKKTIILLVIILLGAGGVFIYQKNKSKTINQGDVLEGTTSTEPVVDRARQQEFEQAIQKISISDQDMDGISDSEETKYKTDPTSADTDGDGLTDWQEIYIFSTDPLKADTDGDNFADGYEVRRGFSPKGPGKL